MASVYIEIADKISFALKEGKKFDEAFKETMRNYSSLNWGEVRREIGSILGKRERSPRVKVPEQQDLLLEFSRAEAIRHATEHEASLTAGLPEHDL